MLRIKRKPFHKSILDIIRDDLSREYRELLARIICSTEIPKGHNEIIKAWESRYARFGNLGVIHNLHLQKRAAQRKAAKKAKTAAAAI